MHWLVVIVFLSGAALGADISCPQELIEALQATHPLSARTVQLAEAFAKRHGLPTRVVKVGYPDHPRYRLFVGIDARNRGLMQDYINAFHVSSRCETTAGYLIPTTYRIKGREDHTPAVRSTAPNAGSLMGVDGVRGNALEIYEGNSEHGLLALEHVIPLSEKRRASVLEFYEQPRERGPVKTDNCTAWLSGIELGKISSDASTLDRHHLAHYLGFSRTIEHVELGRRLLHASNQNHSVIFVVANADLRNDFEHIFNRALLPMPKISASSVLRGTPAPTLPPDLSAAIARIPNGGRVFFPLAAGASPEAFEGLVRRSRVTGDTFSAHLLINGISENLIRAATTLPGRVKVNALFVGKSHRGVSRELLMDRTPVYLGMLGKQIEEHEEAFTYDALVVRVAPADARGLYSLGTNYDHIPSVLAANPNAVVIAEVNPNVPRTGSNNYLREDQITAKFASTSVLVEAAGGAPTDVEVKIAKNIASLIPSGAHLQIGIGGVFSALPKALLDSGVRDLVLRTEVLSDAGKALIENGVAKSATTTFVYGSRGLYDWLENNPRVTFETSAVLNSIPDIARHEKFHALNTALQVSLAGEVNATIFPDGTQGSSPGGQVEFFHGASFSPGGRSILALRSTALGDTVSSIAPFLYFGPITTPGPLIDYVVTEFGVAKLKGKTVADRALALIAVAHPKFQKELLAEAVKNGQISQLVADGVGIEK